MHIKNLLIQPLAFRSQFPIYPSLSNAFEYWLMKNTQYPTCYIRHTNRCVVLGANQLAFAECNLKKMELDNVKLIRRKSGGGAVYLDSGNSLFGIVGNKADVTQQIFTDILTSSIYNVFDVIATPTGKNDISVDMEQFERSSNTIKRKVSGLAYNMDGNNMLCHACTLVDCDIDQFQLYLTPNQKKIESHHVKSMDKRVVNLKHFDWTKTRIDLENELINSFFDKYIETNNKHKTIINIDAVQLLEIPDVKKIYEDLSSDEFIYGKNVKYNKKISEKFPWGFIELFLNIENNKIISISVNTDCLDVLFPNKVIDLLKDKYITNIEQCDDTKLNDVSQLLQ